MRRIGGRSKHIHLQQIYCLFRFGPSLYLNNTALFWFEHVMFEYAEAKLGVATADEIARCTRRIFAVSCCGKGFDEALELLADLTIAVDPVRSCFGLVVASLGRGVGLPVLVCTD